MSLHVQLHAQCMLHDSVSGGLQVVMRVRPMNGKEFKVGAKAIVHPVDDKVSKNFIYN